MIQQSPQTRVSVIGLGAMGSAIARAFLKAGHTTTVWNRSPERASPLVALGAAHAESSLCAAQASRLVVLSLLDAAAVCQVLESAPSGLDGRLVVDLTSKTPEDAVRIASLVEQAGGRALMGAVMVTPNMIGTEHAMVLVSGEHALFEESRATLAALGVEPLWVGEAPGSAALLDLGMLDFFFGSITAYIHAAALVGTGGVSAASFMPYAKAMLDLVAVVIPELAAEVDERRYPGEENSLAMMLRAVHHIEQASEARALNPSVPRVTRELMQAAVNAGHGAEGYGRLAETLRGSR